MSRYQTTGFTIEGGRKQKPGPAQSSSIDGLRRFGAFFSSQTNPAMNRIIRAAMIMNGQTIMLEYLVLGPVSVVPPRLIMTLLRGPGGSRGCKTL